MKYDVRLVSRFKSDVLSGYYFTCALTGYRLDTSAVAKAVTTLSLSRNPW